MNKARLEAFSDGVIAIIITIMVLGLSAPAGTSFASLLPVAPALLGYVLSFVYVGIYWNNHHHMLSISQRVSGKVLWANLHLLFWLSLFPFTTAWMGRNHLAATPTAIYGVVLLLAALAYWMLQQCLMAADGPASALRRAIGVDRKGKLSPLLYLLGIALTFWRPWAGQLVYALIALMWLVPDRRIERLSVESGTDGNANHR